MLQEFRRLDSQLGAARDRAELLAGAGDTLPLLSVQVQSGTGALLRERATLSTSTNYVSVCWHGLMAQQCCSPQPWHGQGGSMGSACVRRHTLTSSWGCMRCGGALVAAVHAAAASSTMQAVRQQAQPVSFLCTLVAAHALSPLDCKTSWCLFTPPGTAGHQAARLTVTCLVQLVLRWSQHPRTAQQELLSGADI